MLPFANLEILVFGFDLVFITKDMEKKIFQDKGYFIGLLNENRRNSQYTGRD